MFNFKYDSDEDAEDENIMNMEALNKLNTMVNNKVTQQKKYY